MMPVKRCAVTLAENHRELSLHGTATFPCGGYCAELHNHPAGGIPWHWHEEIEVLTVRHGIVQIGLGCQKYTLQEGEGAFINSNVLHTADSANDTGCMVDSIVFHASLIAGTAESVFAQRYVRPLLGCHALPILPFYKNTPWHMQAAQYIRQAYQIYQAEDFGYELLVREKLSLLWLLIAEQMRDTLAAAHQKENQDSIRMKLMLDYIHQNYAQPLTLLQIAAAASVSQRECLRCFEKNIQIPPMQYLLKYRVCTAARLLRETDAPVTEICGLCGFDSPSYFAKMFKRLMGESPTRYRKTQCSNCPDAVNSPHMLE